MDEKWLRLEEFPNYAVSNHGQFANIKRETLVRPSINNRGILKVGLVRDRVQVTRSAAVLVAEAFMPDHEILFDTPVNLDGVRTNCRLDNLLWLPRNRAQKYHRQFQYPMFRESTLPIQDEETGEVYEGFAPPCTTFGMHFMDVQRSYLNRLPTFPTGQVFRLL